MTHTQRLILTFSGWLAHWAGTLGAWSFALERYAKRGWPECPDCGQPEVDCYCALKAEQQRELEAMAFDFYDREPR